MFGCSMLSRQVYNTCWMIVSSALEGSRGVSVYCLCNEALQLLASFMFVSNVEHFLHTYDLFSWFSEFPSSFLFNLVDFAPLIKENRFDSC